MNVLSLHFTMKELDWWPCISHTDSNIYQIRGKLPFSEYTIPFVCFSHKKYYVKDFNNFVDLGCSVLILCVIPLRFTNHNEQWHVFAFGYILWAFRIFKIAKLNK